MRTIEDDHHGADADDPGAPNHDHGSSVRSRLAHSISEVFGGHAHDPAEQVDDTLEASDEGRRALLISLVVLAATAALQGVVVVLSGSVALLGDTLHNVADALTAVPLLLAFRLGRRPANARYTYGYGRAEDLAGVFVIAMIALSSVLAGWEAINRLLHPHAVSHLWAVGVAATIGFVGNELVARYRIVVGRRIGSAALVADGLHARTDGFTSLAVLVGAVGVAVGWRWADPVVGLVITVAILGVLRSAGRQVFARLMDAVDPDLVATIERVLAQTGGVRGVDVVRVRWIGHTLHAEAALTVDPTLSLAAAHEVAHDAERQLLHAVPRLAGALVHAGPDELQPTAHDLAAHHRRARPAGSVSLRPVEVDDLPILFEHQRDPVACAMAGFASRERDAFMTHWDGILSNPSVISRTVLLDGAVAGNIAAFDYEGRREVGYWIGREWWGRGVATRALVEFLAVEISRPIYAGVALNNAGSIRVLEKCGFARCGEQDGLIDLVLDD